MKYMMIVKADRRYEAGAPLDPKLVEAVAKHADDMARAGILLGTGGLLPSLHGARIHVARGKLSVTDGPFAESKELIGGYAIVCASSKEEAIELGRIFMQIHVDVLGNAYEGELEIRQMFEAEDCASEGARSEMSVA